MLYLKTAIKSQMLDRCCFPETAKVIEVLQSLITCCLNCKTRTKPFLTNSCTPQVLAYDYIAYLSILGVEQSEEDSLPTMVQIVQYWWCG